MYTDKSGELTIGQLKKKEKKGRKSYYRLTWSLLGLQYRIDYYETCDDGGCYFIISYCDNQCQVEGKKRGIEEKGT
jgi:hypothetical protein